MEGTIVGECARNILTSDNDWFSPGITEEWKPDMRRRFPKVPGFAKFGCDCPCQQRFQRFALRRSARFSLLHQFGWEFDRCAHKSIKPYGPDVRQSASPITGGSRPGQPVCAGTFD
jgi:hypothetical protein